MEDILIDCMSVEYPTTCFISARLDTYLPTITTLCMYVYMHKIFVIMYQKQMNWNYLWSIAWLQSQESNRFHLQYRHALAASEAWKGWDDSYLRSLKIIDKPLSSEPQTFASQAEPT